MKRFLKSKKGLSLLATLVVVAASAIGAYAYYSSTGSGSGTVTASTDTSSVTLAATITGTLAPGGSALPVSFTATNAQATTGRVSTISFVSVTDVTTPTPAAGCVSYLSANQGDFTLAGSPIAENTSVPTGTTSMPNGSTLAWANNSTVNQTPCAGETLQLNVATP